MFLMKTCTINFKNPKHIEREKFKMKFLKANKRFSFKLGDKNSWDLNYKSEIKEDGSTLITTYYFEGGLKVTNIAKKYEKFGA